MGGHDTYSARVSRTGALSISPRVPDEEEHAAGSAPQGGVPLTLWSESIRRGSVELLRGQREARLQADGSLAIDLGPVSEHLVPRADGISQSWYFEHMPEGRGPLVVTLRTSGLRFHEQTPGGLHFLEGPRGLGVRYGPAAWIDAAGRRHPLVVRALDRAIHIEVPEAQLAQSRYPARLDPLLSPELGMDNPVVGPIQVNQEEPAVAWNGSLYLVVWRDYRSKSQNDLWGARLSKTGNVLDSTGLLLHHGTASIDRPAIASDGTDFLVVWEQKDPTTDFDLLARRVSSSGTVLDAAPIPVSQAADSQLYPRVSFDGQNYLVVWEDRRGGTYFDIFGARVSPAGQVKDAAGIPICTASKDKKRPALCHSQGQALVAWTDPRNGLDEDIYGARVSAAGVVLDPLGFGISTEAETQKTPAMGCDGQGYLVAWQDERNNAVGDLYGARVDASGQVKDPKGFMISKQLAAEEAPDLAWDGQSFLTVWQDQRASALYDIYGARVSALGVLLDIGGLMISGTKGYQEAPRVASDGNGFMVVWKDRRHDLSYDIYAARVSASGVNQDPAGIPVSSAANLQRGVGLAAASGQFLAVWEDSRVDPLADVMGTRLGPTGTALDLSGLEVAKAKKEQVLPMAAAGGGVYLVVYEDYEKDSDGDVRGLRVDPKTGAILDPVPIDIAVGNGHQGQPHAAFDGTQFLVVWRDNKSLAGVLDIYGKRVSAAGTVLDPAGLSICTVAGDQEQPRTAAHGSQFLVVWQDKRNAASGYDIYGARVDSSGLLPGAAGGFPISTAAGNQRYPQTSPSGSSGQFMVVWQDERNVQNGIDVYGARVDSGGTVLDPAGLALVKEASHQQRPVLASDGTRTLVAWQDLRSGTSWDLMGTLVDAQGQVLFPLGFTLADTLWNEEGPALVPVGSYAFLLGYHRFDPSVGLGTTRVRARFVRWLVDGQACKGNGDCQSGLCFKGICATAGDGGLPKWDGGLEAGSPGDPGSTDLSLPVPDGPGPDAPQAPDLKTFPDLLVQQDKVFIKDKSVIYDINLKTDSLYKSDTYVKQDLNIKTDTATPMDLTGSPDTQPVVDQTRPGDRSSEADRKVPRDVRADERSPADQTRIERGPLAQDLPWLGSRPRPEQGCSCQLDPEGLPTLPMLLVALGLPWLRRRAVRALGRDPDDRGRPLRPVSDMDPRRR